MFLSLQKIIKHNKFTKMKKFFKLIPALLLIFGLASFSGCGVNPPPCNNCGIDTIPHDTVPNDTVPNDTIFPINIPFIVIGQDVLYGSGTEGFTKQFSVITTQENLNNLKAQLNFVNNLYDFTETDIDFSLYQIIFVIDKVKGNGGWSIDVTDVTENSNNIVVTVSNLKKGNTASVITQPFEVVKIPVSNKQIVFNDLTLSHNENE